MGDIPSLWIGLKRCRVDLTSAVSPCEKLHQTLSSKKLQFLEQLHLVCSRKNCILRILLMIARDHPAIRKLSLEVDPMEMFYDSYRISNARDEFEEVNFQYLEPKMNVVPHHNHFS